MRKIRGASGVCGKDQGKLRVRQSVQGVCWGMRGFGRIKVGCRVCGGAWGIGSSLSHALKLLELHLVNLPSYSSCPSPHWDLLPQLLVSAKAEEADNRSNLWDGGLVGWGGGRGWLIHEGRGGVGQKCGRSNIIQFHGGG